MQNRVTPLGDVVAISLRGAWTGNRGRLHEGTRIARNHRGKLWITCALTFRDWRLEQWSARSFTVLYFHDEAVALAAGHRPCALCRRAAYRSYRDRWPTPAGRAVAAEMDRQLHAERLVGGSHTRRLHRVEWSALPDGAFVMREDEPYLVLGDAIVHWTHEGYAKAKRRPTTRSAVVVTPPSTLAVLRAGYPLQIDQAAAQLAGDRIA